MRIWDITEFFRGRQTLPYNTFSADLFPKRNMLVWAPEWRSRVRKRQIANLAHQYKVSVRVTHSALAMLAATVRQALRNL